MKNLFFRNNMTKQKEYDICISARISSSLTAKKIESLLVASLFDIETAEKISDGHSHKFEVLDYQFTKVVNANENRKNTVTD
ncbi:hypothetical protein [Bathymodiolus thermophilus thioautotrophic gill symbiont]|uniref:Uncharacterized protein n=1 Tax=Bathymodiolus thermophilus thioautotrophic gill symbiont TaxID=2360 RepID=A0A1J5ULF6_9GAMM|nr:hypothetical protein [Bathymodiolus thermophilus thioautotrophic gill symbiont]OIR25079.1 hypothetical protein BGC33_05480 [Bathymodiolus thermophilus thioautotrophic gill symbiont]